MTIAAILIAFSLPVFAAENTSSIIPVSTIERFLSISGGRENAAASHVIQLESIHVNEQISEDRFTHPTDGNHPLPTTHYALVNLGPDLKQYTDQFQNQSAEAQWAGWKSFEARHSKYFQNHACSESDTACEAKQKERLTRFFQILPSIADRMWNVFAHAAEITAAQLSHFQKTFPGSNSNILVVFLPSLLTSNGTATNVDKQPTLLIAADHIAYKNDDLDILFAHELFHLHQYSKLQNKTQYGTFASILWLEGFAVWASLLVNPHATDATALMNAELGQFCSIHANVAAMAKEFMPVLRQRFDEPNTLDLRKDWFIGGGSTIPKRRGYCLGLHVIREALKTMAVPDLLSLDENDYTSLISELLKKLTDN